jgi:tripartite-type tricarboxylate transporter receptor subunit TctC
VSTWYGIWGVKGTPQAILDRMHAEVVKAVTSPELKDVWAGNGSDTATMSQQDFAKFLNSEIKRWAAVTKSSGAKLD